MNETAQATAQTYHPKLLQERRATQSQQIFRRRVGALAVMAAIAVPAVAAGGARPLAHDALSFAKDRVAMVKDAFAANTQSEASPDGTSYSAAQLADMPQKTFTFRPGQGIDDAIAKVDGAQGIFSNGPGLQSVEDYVAGQTPGGVPQQGETVTVPVIQGTGK